MKFVYERRRIVTTITIGIIFLLYCIEIMAEGSIAVQVSDLIRMQDERQRLRVENARLYQEILQRQSLGEIVPRAKAMGFIEGTKVFITR